MQSHFISNHYGLIGYNLKTSVVQLNSVTPDHMNDRKLNKER